MNKFSLASQRKAQGIKTRPSKVVRACVYNHCGRLHRYTLVAGPLVSVWKHGQVTIIMAVGNGTSLATF